MTTADNNYSEYLKQERERAKRILNELKEVESHTEMHQFVINDKLTICCKNPKNISRYKKYLESER